MNNFEIFIMWILVIFRFIVIVGSIILPITILIKLFSSIGKNAKKTCCNILSLFLSFCFIYLVFANIEVPANVNIESIKKHGDYISSLDYGSYEFDTGYINGQIYVYEVTEHESYTTKTKAYKTYYIDQNTTCFISPVFCHKDTRLSHAFEPTVSSGTIEIENNKNKMVEISYHYNSKNIAIFLWPITNPEIIYRHQIEINDILTTLKKT